MPDPFIYREVKALLTARIPDTADADENPDRVPLNGYGTAHPKFKGGSVVFAEQGEFAIPRDIPVRVVDGHLMVEVFDGDELILQPLFLPVTVDARANQNWSYQLTFGALTIGERGDEITHPPLSFPVEEGEGPLELSTVATAVVQSGAFITRGAPGAGLTDITAENGRLAFEYSDGRVTTVEVPDTVPGPPGPMVDVQAGTVEVGETTEDYAVTVTGSGETRHLNVTLPKPEKGDKGDKGDDGVANPEDIAPFVEDELRVIEHARNLIPNPLMAHARTVASWQAASGAQPAPTWSDDRLRWEPTTTGTNLITPPMQGEPGQTFTVQAKVRAAGGTTPRLQLFHGTTVTGATAIGSASGTTAGTETTLTATGTIPAGSYQWRVGISVLSAAGWVEAWEVTTADEAFDGDTYTGPGDVYRWTGEPYQSTSVHLTGGLAGVVSSTGVRQIVTSATVPASNPSMAGTLYVVPAPRVPVFTDFDTGMGEVTPRWDLSVGWTASDSAIRKPVISSYVGRAGFSLNSANQATDGEILVLGTIDAGSTGNQVGCVMRGGGADGDPATATGVTAMARRETNGTFRLALQEYRPTLTEHLNVTLAGSGPQFWVRLRTSGSMAFAKAWAFGTAEPVDWMIATAVQTTGGGWVGARSSTAGAVAVNRMGVSFDHRAAPGAY